MLGFTVHESILTILCSLPGAPAFWGLQHCQRNGHFESTGVSFGAGVHRGELAGAGSLSLARR